MNDRISRVDGKLADTFLKTTMLFVVPIAAVVIYRASYMGLSLRYLHPLFFLVFASAIFLMRNHLSVAVKIHASASVFMIAGISEFYTLGLSGLYIMSFMSVILTAMALGRRPAFLYMLVFIISYSFIGYCLITGRIVIHVDLNSNQQQLEVIGTRLLSITWMFVLVLFSFSYFRTKFTETIIKLDEKSETLSRLNMDLQDRFASLPIALAIISSEGRLTYINNMFIDLFGYTIEDVPDIDHWYKMTRPSNARSNTELKIWKRQLSSPEVQNGEIVSNEFPVLCRDGSQKISEIGYRRLGNDYILYFIDKTAKRKMEEQNRQSELRYRNLFDYTDDGIILFGQDGKILDYNAGFRKLTGYGRNDLKDTDLQFFFQQNQAGKGAAAIKRKLKNIAQGKNIGFEWTFRKKQNDEFTGHVRAYSIVENNQHLLYLVIHDITEQKNTHMIAAARLNILEFADDSGLSDLLVKTIDEIECLTGSKAGFFTILPAEDGEKVVHVLSSKTLQSSRLPDGITNSENHHINLNDDGILSRVISEKKHVIHNDLKEESYDFAFPDGHVEIVRGLVVPVIRNGKVVAIVGVGNKAVHYTEQDIYKVNNLADLAWDVMIKKRAEEELRESKRKLEAAQQIGRLGYWHHDLSTDQLVLSKELQDIFAIGKRKRINTYQDMLELVHPDDRRKVDSSYRKSLKGSRHFSLIHRILIHSRHVRYINQRCEISYDDKGKAIATFSTASDITQLKSIEMELIQSLSEKNTLLRELYHRTKNNMQIINSILEIQRQKISDRKLDMVFLEIENKIRTMSLVHEKLYNSKDLSKIELSEYVRDLSDLLYASYCISPAKISMEISCKKLYLYIENAIPFGLVLNELLTNSLKYAFPESTEGKISIKIKRNKSNEIVLDYSDNGIGIPEPLTPEKPGSMGMQIIFSVIIDQLGGSVSVNQDTGLHYKIKFKDRQHA